MYVILHFDPRSPSPKLSHMGATSHLEPVKFEQIVIRQNEKLSFSVTLVTFQVLIGDT